MIPSAPRSPKIPILLTGLTAILSLLLLLYIHLSSHNALQKYIPWFDASKSINLELTRAYLIFKKHQPDTPLKTVKTHLNQSKWFITAILDGANTKQTQYLPLKNKKLRLQVNQLLYLLQQFQEQLESHDSQVDSQEHSPESEDNLDLLFSNLTQKTEQLETALKLHIEHESQAQSSLLAMLLVAICSMTMIAAFSTWRFSKSRANYLHQLSLANHQISEQNKQLQELAHTDQLTGLPNRKMLEAITAQALSRVDRKNTNLSITFIDLDFFKPINDEFGHNVGDKVLTQLTRVINKQLREGDVLARLAGDEFILLLQADSENELRGALDNILTRVNARLEQPILMTPGNIHIRCSAGSAIAPIHGRDFETLLHNADVAMYCSKRRGRGQHCYFESEGTTSPPLMNPGPPEQEAATE